jgi:hypothetical protein
MSYPFYMWKNSRVTVQLSILCIAVWLMLVAEPAKAQGSKALENVKSLNAPSSTNKIRVYYSPGYEKRALEMRSLIEDAMRFYERKLNLKVELSLAVLTKLQWNQVEAGPYGLPWVSSSPHVAFLPATATEGVVTADALSRKSNASPATLKKIKSSGYSFEDGAEKFVDLIGLHELGHTYAISLGLRPPHPSKWFSELVASYFAYAYLRERHPKLATLFYAMTADLVAGSPKPKYTSLADFERVADIEPGNYSWYQGKFFQRVGQVYDAKGLSFFADVRKAFPPGEKESPSLEIVLQRLEQISPGFIEWSKGFQ